MSKIALFFILISAATAQQSSGVLQFDWDKLAAKAVEKSDINLDGPLLQMASKFLSGQDADTAKIRQAVQGLTGIYVKSFEFDKEGQYTEADVSALRSQLRSPEWSNIVDVKEKHESSAIFLKTDGKQAQGMVIISAEPKELTVVQIIGVVDPSVLSELGGKMGIPKMEMGPKHKTAPPKKDDD
jgi:hypothetical protein